LHDIRLLLASCGTPTNPASKLFQFAIAHIFPHLRSKMKDTKAILTKLLEIKEKFPNGLPEGAVNVGCDVKKLYPSIDSVLAFIAVDAWLQLYPNPDGLSRELLMDLGKICMEENSCEFLGRFFCPNTGTATGPPHACDLADIFMGELDKIVVQQLDEKKIETTGWTLYRDDG
jgi:hypothetical protein